MIVVGSIYNFVQNLCDILIDLILPVEEVFEWSFFRFLCYFRCALNGIWLLILRSDLDLFESRSSFDILNIASNPTYNTLIYVFPVWKNPFIENLTVRVWRHYHQARETFYPISLSSKPIVDPVNCHEHDFFSHAFTQLVHNSVPNRLEFHAVWTISHVKFSYNEFPATISWGDPLISNAIIWHLNAFRVFPPIMCVPSEHCLTDYL